MQKVTEISIESKVYPCSLRAVSDSPKTLYCKGNLDSSIFLRCIAVVGSRKMTSYGKKATRYFVEELAGRGVTIVSGFMYGVDAEAHKAALEAGGKTIAVMPCGINRICPDFQQTLYREILEKGGLVVSEYPDEFAPKVWTFPRRNRIVAGLSAGTLVVEAGGKSGSLITAEVTHSLGRPVFAVPGDLFNPAMKGNCQLIGGYARVAISGLGVGKELFGDIFRPINSPEQVHLYKGQDTEEEEILQFLRSEPAALDILHYSIGIPLPILMEKLTSLTLRGLITQEGVNYYVNQD